MRALTIVLDDSAASALRAADVRIAVAKSDGTLPCLVWTVVSPASLVVVRWSERYGLYAAHVPRHRDSLVKRIASVYPARDQLTYAFRGEKFGRPKPENRIPAHHYDVRNETVSALAFGLVQAITVDCKRIVAPINVVALAPGDAADFVPLPDVIVWADASAMPSAVASSIPSDALRVPYGTHRTPEQRCRFDLQTRTFFLESNI